MSNIDRTKYAANSKSPRACLEADKPEPVVKGKVRSKQKTVGQRLSAEIKGDDSRSVGQYLIDTVLIPKGKDLLGDLIHNGIDTVQRTIEVAIFGEVRSRNLGKRSNYRSNYKDYYDDKRTNSARAKSNMSFEEPLFEYRDDANEVLNRMLDRIDQYGCVSIADLQEMMGMSSTYQDRRFGWDRLGTAEIIKVGREYLLDLPRPKPLD